MSIQYFENVSIPSSLIKKNKSISKYALLSPLTGRQTLGELKFHEDKGNYSQQAVCLSCQTPHLCGKRQLKDIVQLSLLNFAVFAPAGRR
jgi:hypothetical protein